MAAAKTWLGIDSTGRRVEYTASVRSGADQPIGSSAGGRRPSLTRSSYSCLPSSSTPSADGPTRRVTLVLPVNMRSQPIEIERRPCSDLGRRDLRDAPGVTDKCRQSRNVPSGSLTVSLALPSHRCVMLHSNRSALVTTQITRSRGVRGRRRGCGTAIQRRPTTGCWSQPSGRGFSHRCCPPDNGLPRG